MARIAFYHEVAEGKRDEYREIHEDVPDDLEAAYRSAGLEQFSLFEKDGFVFGYVEVVDPTALMETMTESDVQATWSEQTLPLLKNLPDDIWMDEIYRLEPN